MGWMVATALLVLGSLVPPAPADGAPGAPTGVTARTGIGSALVSWTPPADPGTSPITSYDVVSSAGCHTSVPAAQASVVLTNDPPVAQTFTVVANNASGGGPASAPSAEIAPAGGGTYHPLDPVRILDTRTAPPGPLGPGETRLLQVRGRAGVPASGVTAVVLNVTVTDTTASSYLTLWPADVQRPLASNLNWTPGVTVANLAEVGLVTFQSVSDSVGIFNSQGSVDVVIDLEGYVGDESNSSTADGMFDLLSPVRLLDTRTGGGAIGPGQTRDLQVAGRGGVPATGVSAVVVNVTATNPTANSHLTVWPSGTAMPLASNLNFFPTLTVANRVMVKVGAGGRISIFNSLGTVDVLVDVNGWFTDATSGAGGSGFFTGPPARVLDTRTTGLPLTGGAPPEVVDVHGLLVSAVAVNITATDVTANTFLTVWPDGAPRPGTSDLNPRTGRTTANLTVVGVTEAPVQRNLFDIVNDTGSVDVIVDFQGGYTSPVAPLPAATIRQPCKF